MKKILLLTLCCLAFSAVSAEDVKVVIPTTTSANYALYPAPTGVFLRLDTRDGTIQAIVPSNPTKNKALITQALAAGAKPGRFELYPTDYSWEWVLFDTETGDMWLLKWADKKNVLTKISTPAASE